MNRRDRRDDDEQALVAARVRALREQGRARRPDRSPAAEVDGLVAPIEDVPAHSLLADRIGPVDSTAPTGWLPPAVRMPSAADGDPVPRSFAGSSFGDPSIGSSSLGGSDDADGAHGAGGDDPGDGDRPGSRVRSGHFREHQDWAHWRERFRLDPGRRGLVALAGVVVVVGAIAGGWMLNGQPGSTAVAGSAQPVAAVARGSDPGGGAAVTSSSPARATASREVTTTASAGATGAGIVIDVAGQVGKPGVYTLPPGSRVEDALVAAGGPLPGADLSLVNRARVLSDGEQIAVGIAGAAPVADATGGGSSGSAGGGSSPGGVVDLNSADVTALDTLPGVGPVLAQHIVDWRSEHGRFSSVDDLQQVSGIGPSKFAEIKDLVRV